MATDLKNIDLQDVLPYMPNPVDGDSLENLHRDLISELDKISFLTEVLRDKIDIVDENIATVDAKGDSDAAQKIKEEVDKALKELSVLEQKVSDQAGLLSQTINRIDTDIAQESIERAKAISDEITARSQAIAAEAKARTEAILTEQRERTKAIADAVLSGAAPVKKELDKIVADLQKEIADRIKSVNDEVAARKAAILSEANTRAALIAQEQKVRTDSIAAEASSRASALLAEANSRATAIAKEQGERATAISTEKSERVAADLAFSRLITSLTSVVDGNVADLVQESNTRATSDSAISSRVTALTSKVGDVETSVSKEVQARSDADAAITSSISALTSKVGSNLANITSESKTRATEISAVNSKVDNLVTKTENNSSRITQEASTRTTQDAALGRRIDTVVVTSRNNGAAIANEVQARVSADDALAQKITTLTSTVGDTVADIKSEKKARADQDSAIGSRIDNVVASIGNVTGELDNYSFDKGKKNWSLKNFGKDAPENAPGTVKAVVGIGNVLELSGRNVLYYGRAIPVQTDRTYRVRIKVYQSKDGSNTNLQDIYAGVACLDSGYTNVGNRYTAVASRKILKKDGWLYFEGLITGTSSSTSAHNNFVPNTTFVKPMFIVNNGGGNGVTEVDLLEFIDITDRQTVLAAIQDESTARATKDAAITNQLNSLSSEVTKNTRSAASLATRVTKTETDISGKASTSEVNNLTSKVTSNDRDISGLVTRMSTAEANINGKASATSVNSLSSKVTKNASDLGKANTVISGNSTKISKITTDLSGKASASDVNTLASTVSGQGRSITSVSERVNNVESNLKTKASVAALSSLAAKVTSNDSDISSLVNRTTTAEANIAGKASIGSVNNLSTEINTANSNIAANTRSITQVKSDIGSLATTSTINELSAKVNKNISDIVDERRVRASSDSSLSTRVTTLTSSVTKNNKDIQAVNTQLTLLNTAIGGKATAEAVNNVLLKANDNANKVSSLTSRVTKAEVDIKGFASSNALTVLTSKVNKNASDITTEKNTRASQDNAIGKRIDAVVAKVESFNNQVVNFDFEADKQAWSTLVSGVSAPNNLPGSVVKVPGEGKVLQTASSITGYYANAIPVDTSRKYKMRVKVKQTVNSTNGSGKNGFYAGVATLDSNYNNQTGGAGTHRYFVYSGGQLTVDKGWVVYEGIITGEGSSHHNFRPDTAYVKPMFITSYSGGNGDTQIAYVKFWDATEEIDNKAAVTTEQKARADGDKSLGSRIDTISTQVRNKADNSVVSGLATRVTSVETLASGKASASSVSSLQTKVNQNAANITSEIKARSDRDKSLTSSITGLSSKVDGKASNSTVSALTRRVTTAEANINGKASVSSVNTLQTKVNQNTASVQTAANSINGLKAQYTIKTEATTGGSRVIAGIGLLADAKANISEVAITADNFFVIPATRKTNFNPRTDKQFSPFLVSGNKTYLQNAFIRNASIDTAKIKDLSVVTAKIANFAIDSTKIRDASITNVKIANVIQSNDYIAGKRGWKIDKAGAVEFGSGKFRGDISGATGTFSGNLSGAKGTFSGDISGASGTFSGTVYADKIDGDIIKPVKSNRILSFKSTGIGNNAKWVVDETKKAKSSDGKFVDMTDVYFYIGPETRFKRKLLLTSPFEAQVWVPSGFDRNNYSIQVSCQLLAKKTDGSYMSVGDYSWESTSAFPMLEIMRKGTYLPTNTFIKASLSPQSSIALLPTNLTGQIKLRVTVKAHHYKNIFSSNKGVYVLFDGQPATEARALVLKA